MNASLWQLAGWTMIHSLWLGGAVALAGGFLRLACRRAAPNTRYAISLATLTALALTPLATAAWLSVNGVPAIDSVLLPLPQGEGWGEGQNPLSTTPPASATAENPSLQGKGIEGTPSRMPGLSGQVIDLAHTSPSSRSSGEWSGEGFYPSPTTPQRSAAVENPSPNPSLQGRGIPLSPTRLLTHALPLLPTLWLIGAPLTFTLLATGLLGSARLRRRATPLTAGPAFDACERLRQTLKITRRVALAACDGVAQPILVGVLRPLILLPTAALAGWTPDQLDMVLLHELAHVRRWDNLVNLLQRIVESLLFFHPAVWLLSRQVRRDREECCDAAVIAHTARPHQYAELLVSIAAALRGGPAPSLAVASAMASHPLAGRIRRILNLEEEPMRITRRTLAATLLLPLLLAGAIFYSGASAQDPPPSKGGARGGIPDAKQPNTPYSDEKKTKSEGDEDSYTANYPIQPNTQIDLVNFAKAVGGHNLKLDIVAGEWAIVLHAPKHAHNRLRVLLGDKTLPQPSAPVAEPAASSWPAAASWNDVPAPASARQSDGAKAHSDIPQLQNEIRNLETLIGGTQEELKNIEVFKDLSVQNSQNNEAIIDEAVRKELEADPKLKILTDRLLNIERSVADEELNLAKGSAEDDGETIKNLGALRETAETKRDAYLTEAKIAARERIAKLPNEALLAAVTEYKIRRKSAEENLAKYKQKLEAARAKVLQLGAKSSILAPEPAPLLDRLEQLRAAFDAQRPLFEKDPNSPVEKVRYDGANLPDIVGDHWPYLVKGISNEPGKPPVWFNWTGLGNKNYELEVPAAAHEKFFRPMFDGMLPTLTGGPGSPNQGGAATGSSDKAAETLFTKQGLSLNSEDLALSLAQDRANERIAIERSMRKRDPRRSIEMIQAELTTDRSLLQLELELLKIKFQSQSRFPEIESPGRRAAIEETAARLKAIREQLEIEREAGGPGSPNQTGAATESNANAAPATREPSPILAPAPAPAQASSAHLGVTVLQPPTWIDRGGPYKRNTRTTAYLKIPAPLPLDYFDEERVNILRAALASKKIASLQTVKKQADALTWLHQRLHDSVDGEVLTLKLRYGDGPDDEVILQAVIDAFIAGMKAWASPAKAAYAPPKSPADPNAASDAAAPAPGDLSRYVGPAADSSSDPQPLTTAPSAPKSQPLAVGDVVLVQVTGALPDQTIDDAYNVDDLGTIALGPTYGRVPVVGLSILEAEKAIQEKLQTILENPLVQVSRLSKPEAATQSTGGEPTFLYDGKTFDQWRDLWKLELNPERRTEAINALAAFGRTGQGQEAADAILEVAGEYGDKYGNGSPEGKLLLAILTAVSRMPAEQWMTQVQERIAAANESEKAIWIRHAARFLGASDDRSDDARRHAAKFADIPSDELVTATALYLLRSDPSLDQPETVQLLRRAFQQKSPGISVLTLGFRHLDKVPEQLDILIRDGGIRSALNTRIANDKAMAARLYPPLLEMLKDPDRAEDRVGVLRALRVIGPVIRSHESSEGHMKISKEITELLRTAPDELLPAVLVTFSKYWGSSDYDAILASLLEQGRLPAERIKHLRDLDEQAMFEEAHAQ